MAANSKFAYPSDDLVASGTMFTADEDLDYPVENLQDDDPANVYKSGSTTATISVAHASSARYFVAVFNHNLTSGAVGGIPLTIPARTSDGQSLPAYATLNLGAGISTLLSFTAASNVQVGKVVLVPSLRDLFWLYGLEMYRRHPVNSIRTGWESEVLYDKGISLWGARGMVNRETSRTAIEGLWLAAKGRIKPWMLIPDINTPEPQLVRFTSDTQSYRRIIPNATEMPIEVESVSSGLPL